MAEQPNKNAGVPGRPSGKTTNLTAGGRVPPQAVDLEEAVLGALLIDKNALSRVIDILHSEAFYKEQHHVWVGCMWISAIRTVGQHSIRIS